MPMVHTKDSRLLWVTVIQAHRVTGAYHVVWMCRLICAFVDRIYMYVKNHFQICHDFA